MTAQQAADLLGINDSLVRSYCRSGRIKATQHGRAWWITDAALKRFQKKPRHRGRPK